MSLKTLLMPVISQHLLSLETLQKNRARAERLRTKHGRAHEVHYFHQVDDPYSALVAQCLANLQARYSITLVPHVVGQPPDAAAPERAMLVAHSRRDAALLARHWHLPWSDTGAQPAPDRIELATNQLVEAIATQRFAEVAPTVCTSLWRGNAQTLDARKVLGSATLAAARSQLELSNRLRQSLGHYLGATFFYEGEWYWGIDRLHHLETRLTSLGLRQAPGSEPLFPPAIDRTRFAATATQATIDFYFSLRSPYSAIVTPRVFALAQRSGARLNLKFVLPMVMRGLPVPKAKRTYISLDAAREARMRGVPFGRLNDPLGRPTERGLSLIPFAERHGKAQAYVAAFMHAVWSRGVDAGSDRGLRQITDAAGLSWADARVALQDNAWRDTAERNRAEMFSLGLWGVPSFRVKAAHNGSELAVWGQDRLWAIEEALA